MQYVGQLERAERLAGDAAERRGLEAPQLEGPLGGASGTIARPAAGPQPAYGLVAAAFAVVAAYVVLLPLLGFRIATALFVAAFQATLEPPRTLRQWAVLIAIALSTSALTYLVFEQYILVLLPRGAWTGW